ncbi:MAG TPA: PTS sugar transporter subunit IIA, partial [Spirochaetota bacterium]|nr:PTS sugar transporter subunit IIA [Spirochaetota bacterium]
AMASPPLLNKLLSSPLKGTKKDFKKNNRRKTSFTFETTELADFILTKALEFLRNEGFYISRIETGESIYYLRKEKIFITLTFRQNELDFDSDHKEVTYIKTVIYESMLDLKNMLSKVDTGDKPEKIKKELIDEAGYKTQKNKNVKNSFRDFLIPGCINYNLKSKNKEDVLRELLDLLDDNHCIDNRNIAETSVFEREKTMSTGMKDGLALPHGKTSGVTRMYAAVGVSKKGIDFNSLDQKPAHLFIMLLSPTGTTGPHIELLSQIGSIFSNPEVIKKVTAMQSNEEIYNFFIGNTA